MERIEITKALRNFGIKSRNINICIRDNVSIVYVDQDYFGIYDFCRHTFVD